MQKIESAPVSSETPRPHGNSVASEVPLRDENTTPASSPRVYRPSSGWSIGIAFVIGMLLLGNGLFPRLRILFDSTGNFQWQLVALILALAAYQALRRRRLWMWVIFALAILPLLNIVSLYIPPSQPPPGDSIVRIMSLNILCGNENYEAVCRLINDIEPDIVCFAELTETQAAEISAIESDYPYVVSPKGIARRNVIYSKIPFELTKFRPNTHMSSWLRMAAIDIEVDGQPVMLVNAHTASPNSLSQWELRETQLGELAHMAKAYDQVPHLVLLGDFNATTHCHSLNRILETTRLRDSRQGFGLQNSWPTWQPLLRICIDHVFVSENVHVHRRWVEQDVGSDHFPIVVELSFNANGAER